jgi:predicted TIM-barrel fold metal-dependent hydrolase
MRPFRIASKGNCALSVPARGVAHHSSLAASLFVLAARLSATAVGVDRIMFSTDHPYQSMAEGRAFLDRAPVSDADREKIAHGNAERLFGV